MCRRFSLDKENAALIVEDGGAGVELGRRIALVGAEERFDPFDGQRTAFGQHFGGKTAQNLKAVDLEGVA